jgi:hypothetical protein
LQDAEEDCHFRAALSRSFEYWSDVSSEEEDRGGSGGVEKATYLLMSNIGIVLSGRIL